MTRLELLLQIKRKLNYLTLSDLEKMCLLLKNKSKKEGYTNPPELQKYYDHIMNQPTFKNDEERSTWIMKKRKLKYEAEPFMADYRNSVRTRDTTTMKAPKEIKFKYNDLFK